MPQGIVRYVAEYEFPCRSFGRSTCVPTMNGARTRTNTRKSPTANSVRPISAAAVLRELRVSLTALPQSSVRKWALAYPIKQRVANDTAATRSFRRIVS
jgi:hypothetical protein